MNFAGLDRDATDNPDDYNSYTMGLLMTRVGDRFDYFKKEIETGNCLLIPMDSRTYAGSCGPTEYGFSPSGGFSWVVPYIAGLYAFALQVTPETTLEIFWATALETGDSRSVTINNDTFDLGKIVNPSRLIDKLLSKN